MEAKTTENGENQKKTLLFFAVFSLLIFVSILHFFGEAQEQHTQKVTKLNKTIDTLLENNQEKNKEIPSHHPNNYAVCSYWEGHCLLGFLNFPINSSENIPNATQQTIVEAQGGYIIPASFSISQIFTEYDLYTNHNWYEGKPEDWHGFRDYLGELNSLKKETEG